MSATSDAWGRLLVAPALACTWLVLLGQAGRWDAQFDLLNSALGAVAPALALLLIGALRWKWRFLGALAAIGLGAALFQLGGAMLQTADGTSGAATIRIATINTYHSNQQPDLVRAQLDAVDADIVLLQEANGTAASQIAEALPGFERVLSCPYDKCSLTVLSRWPVERIGLTMPPLEDGRVADLLGVRIATPMGELRAINVHLPRPSQPFAEESRLALLGAIDALGAERLVVAGDFNLATGSFALGRFTEAAGLWRHDWLVPTYPADGRLPPLLPIDHLFTSPDIGSGGCQLLPANGSDHRGLLCEVRVTPAPGAAP